MINVFGAPPIVHDADDGPLHLTTFCMSFRKQHVPRDPLAAPSLHEDGHGALGMHMASFVLVWIVVLGLHVAWVPIRIVL